MKEGMLVPRPDFQRRLVWTGEDKTRFIETILMGFPFPEVYLANGPIDVDTGEGTQLLVDGQQRLTTISGYFSGDPSISRGGLPPYATLDRQAKEDFLNYDVAVRDLGSIDPSQIVEVFRRINSTKYALNDIEVNNAVYAGQFMQFASGLAEHEFFDKNRVFRASDIKRMGDVRFVLQVLVTMMAGYFNRDELLEKYLHDNNEEFLDRAELARRILLVFDYIEECGFPASCRIWKRSDLFTALVEFDAILSQPGVPSPQSTLDRLTSWYDIVDHDGVMATDRAVATYAKASLQASNDRINRLRRAVVFRSIVTGGDPLGMLMGEGLIVS
jgi:hypothetical protein